MNADDENRVQRLSGCAICGDDYEPGDVCRRWVAAIGETSCHDRCYVALHASAQRRRSRWPNISAAKPETFPFERAS